MCAATDPPIKVASAQQDAVAGPRYCRHRHIERPCGCIIGLGPGNSVCVVRECSQAQVLGDDDDLEGHLKVVYEPQGGYRGWNVL